MDRPRSFHPFLLERMKGLSLPTQNFLFRLPFECDDAGRVVLDLKAFGDKLFPGVDRAHETMIPSWLDEAERHGWIEAYRGGDLVLMRMVHWRRDVHVADPQPSILPPSPNEPPESRTPEASEPPGNTPALRAEGIEPAAPAAAQPVKQEESVERRLARLHGVEPRRRAASAARSL